MQIKPLSFGNLFQKQGVNKNKYLTLPDFSKLERSPKADMFSFCGAGAAFLDKETSTNKKNTSIIEDFSSYEQRREYLDNNKRYQELVNDNSLYYDEDDMDLAVVDEDGFRKIISCLDNEYYYKLVSRTASPFAELKDLADVDKMTLEHLDNILQNEDVQKVIDKRGVRYDELMQAALLKEDEFSQFDSFINNSSIRKLFLTGGIKIQTLIMFTKFSPSAINKLHSILNNSSIQKLAQENKINGSDFTNFLYLNSDEYERLAGLLTDFRIRRMIDNNKATASDLTDIAYMSDEEISNYNRIVNNDNISKLIDNGGIGAEHIVRMACLDKYDFKNVDFVISSEVFQKLLENKKIDPLFFDFFVNLNYDGLDRFTKLLKDKRIKMLVKNNKINSSNLLNMIPFNIKGETIKNTLYLQNNGFEEVNPLTVAQILKSNPDFDAKDFCAYAKQVDFNEIEKIVPEVKNFNSTNRLYFLNYHYGERKTHFEPEDFQFGEDFGEYLTKKFSNADEVVKLYSIFPTISRNVGNLPDGWTKDIADEDIDFVKDEVINSIDNFIKTKNPDSLQESLSDIFNKKVTVEKIGEGSFGAAYKISMPDSKDVCLKIFHEVSKNPDFIAKPGLKNEHGRFIEVQNALFANAHSRDYVKMYFGRVGLEGRNDAFMVTQYLTNMDKVEETQMLSDADDYRIIPLDDTTGNYVYTNGRLIYIDFGALKIVNKKTGENLTKGKWARTGAF